jgi:hypothetical protein
MILKSILNMLLVKMHLKFLCGDSVHGSFVHTPLTHGKVCMVYIYIGDKICNPVQHFLITDKIIHVHLYI